MKSIGFATTGAFHFSIGMKASLESKRMMNLIYVSRDNIFEIRRMKKLTGTWPLKTYKE